jgi:hypothetical protein
MKFKQVTRSLKFVMGRGMVLGKVVGEIFFTSTPMNDELVMMFI